MQLNVVATPTMDGAAEELAELAFAAAEAYGSLHGGNYNGLTPLALQEANPSIRLEPGRRKPYLSSAVAYESGEGFRVTVTAISGHTFTVTGFSGGGVERRCTPLGRTGESGGGCQNGTW